MAIKNKDGTNYALRRPNPLTLDQDHWLDTENIEFYNLKWKSKISKEEIPEEVPEVKEEVPEETPEEVPEVKEETPEEVPEVKEREPNLPQKVLDRMLLIHCLLASNKKETDELYNETRNKIIYTKKLVFEGVIFKRSDVTIQLWTLDDITLYSIIYPFRYKNGKPLEHFRWWKVKEIDSKSGGKILTCVPSDIQPDFSGME